jgi:hypothetical protein
LAVEIAGFVGVGCFVGLAVLLTKVFDRIEAKSQSRPWNGDEPG